MTDQYQNQLVQWSQEAAASSSYHLATAYALQGGFATFTLEDTNFVSLDALVAHHRNEAERQEEWSRRALRMAGV